MLNNSLPHSLRVSPTVSDMARKILWYKYARNHKTEFSNREVLYLQAHLDAYELSEVIDGVNFSRVQIDEILRQRRKRGPIEFEALGPYLIDYIESNGIITKDNLIPEDRIGLAIAAKLCKLLPSARLVSLYDDVNNGHGDGGGVAPPAYFSDEIKKNFKKSLLELFVSSGILEPDAIEGTDYLLVAESDKVKSAERMIARLEKLGHILRRDQEIWFVNETAENLLYKKFLLRSKYGHWLCVALDAASFLSEENKSICHLLVLPDYMKQQQDKVWEILRVLSLHPLDYHNIFYSVYGRPQQVAKVIWNRFHQASQL